MKKYLLMALKVIMYMGILYVINQFALFLFFNVWSKDPGFKKFIDQNVPLVIIAMFALTVLVYALIFRLQKKSLLKTCNFSKYKLKSAVCGSLMAAFGAIGLLGIVSLSYIKTSFPVLEWYINTFYNCPSPLVFVILMLVIIPVLEEMIFRGTVFNELKDKMPLAIAIILQAVIYGIVQFNIPVGVFAVICSIIYCIPYAWTGSLWASITVQIVGAMVMLAVRRTELIKMMGKLGDPGLIVISVIAALCLTGSIYLLRKSEFGKTPKNTPEITA